MFSQSRMVYVHPVSLAHSGMRWEAKSLLKFWISSVNLMKLTVVSGVLCVTVVQGQSGWGVTYSSTQVCALEGSTVEIRCNYTYPSTESPTTEVLQTVWFTRKNDDLRTDSEYAGRVWYHCEGNSCTLKITDLRKSDSAKYIFRFITNQPGGSYTGLPGVSLSVTGNVFIWIFQICAEEEIRLFQRGNNEHARTDTVNVLWCKCVYE